MTKIDKWNFKKANRDVGEDKHLKLDTLCKH